MFNSLPLDDDDVGLASEPVSKDKRGEWNTISKRIRSHLQQDFVPTVTITFTHETEGDLTYSTECKKVSDSTLTQLIYNDLSESKRTEFLHKLTSVETSLTFRKKRKAEEEAEARRKAREAEHFDHLSKRMGVDTTPGLSANELKVSTYEFSIAFTPCALCQRGDSVGSLTYRCVCECSQELEELREFKKQKEELEELRRLKASSESNIFTRVGDAISGANKRPRTDP